MWMNGSRSRRSTPAKARRTGKPSPSNPDGAVVTDRTRRRTVPGAGAGTRGRAVVSSTVMAGIGRAPRVRAQLMWAIARGGTYVSPLQGKLQGRDGRQRPPLPEQRTAREHQRVQRV